MNYIIGLDEVGYGCNAGKLTIGGIRAPINWNLPGLKDSKKLSREQRQLLSGELIELSNQNIIQFTLQSASNEEIDQLGLAACHKTCYVRAIKNLYQMNDQIIIDGNLNPKLFVKYGLDINLNNVKSVVKADDQFPTVMGASILAKHHRDSEMIELHQQYPYYDWDNNVGYLTEKHKEGIKKYGLSLLHRRSYKIK